MLFVGTGDTLVFGDWAATPEGNNTRGDLVFALSLLISALYSVDSLIQARSRWRALRSSAGELESLIWRYRTRVEPFTVGSTTQNTGPEWAFNKAIAEWIDELASAANLATTDMVRSYPASVYRHHQDVISNNPPVVYLEGGISRPVTLDVDDFHSPTKPDRYIELRLRPQMEFYRWRVPVYHRWAAFYRAALLLSASIMSALSFYRVEKWVIVVTAFSAGEMIISLQCRDSIACFLISDTRCCQQSQRGWRAQTSQAKYAGTPAQCTPWRSCSCGGTRSAKWTRLAWKTCAV